MEFEKKITGIEYFVEGFLNANLDGVELHFYGTGDLVEWVIEMSNKHPQIKYMGNVSNDEIIKKQQEAFLLINPRPSNQEFCKYSFPSKTIEYMASGTPVLMTRLPGVPEDYFDYVYLLKEETSEGVREILGSILSKSIEENRLLGQKARNYVKENKNCDAQSKRIYDLSRRI